MKAEMEIVLPGVVGFVQIVNVMGKYSLIHFDRTLNNIDHLACS